jgi:hypothetical protein
MIQTAHFFTLLISPHPAIPGGFCCIQDMIALGCPDIKSANPAVPTYLNVLRPSAGEHNNAGFSSSYRQMINTNLSVIHGELEASPKGEAFHPIPERSIMKSQASISHYAHFCSMGPLVIYPSRDT